MILSFIIALWVFSFTISCYAKDITIIYSGETHAMLYPCSCPKEPDGGIARRATLIKQLKKKYPEALTVDSGGFFAGGLMDEYTQNTQLDMERAKVSLQAMELMGYDAAAIGDDELSFGEDFFQQSIKDRKTRFLSANLKAQNVLPFFIKDVSGVKIALIGLTTPAARQKVSKLQIGEPRLALTEQIASAKKQGANLIVVLSHQGESDDLSLINEVPGIDVLVSGHSRSKEEPVTKIKDTILARPSWQGRRIGKLTISLKDNKVTDYKAEELRLSDKVADEPKISVILPRCFSNSDCKKAGVLGICQDPGNIRAKCLFEEAAKINLLVIVSKSCTTCNASVVADAFKKQFPGLVITYLNYPESKKAVSLVKELGLTGLPAYLLGKEVAQDAKFANLKGSVEEKKGYYLLKPEFVGVGYFLERKRDKGSLDIFISLFDKEMAQLLDVVREYHPRLHFLVIAKEDGFDAAKGQPEIEESLRGVCVQKYYPDAFWNYIGCRAKNINSSWWEDCLGSADSAKIRTCAKGEEGKELLRQNISLTKELQVMLGPTYLVDNVEIFASKGAPTREELKKTLKR